MSYCSIRVETPPIPDAIATAVLKGSSVGDPASANASRAAMSANASERSSFLKAIRSIISLGSTATGAAIDTGNDEAHSASIRLTPD
jgi:hypothetical protein